MRKLFIILGTLCLTLSLSGQLLPGEVASQKSSVPDDPEMISNGTFDSGTGWTISDPWTIGSGVANYDQTSTNGITQADGDMLSSIVENTNYRLEFDVVSAGSAYITFMSINYKIYVNGAGYTTGHKTVDFTSPADIGTKGFQIYANDDVAFTIDNISLKPR